SGPGGQGEGGTHFGRGGCSAGWSPGAVVRPGAVPDPDGARSQRTTVRGRPGARPGSERGRSFVCTEAVADRRPGDLPEGRPDRLLSAGGAVPTRACGALPSPASEHY